MPPKVYNHLAIDPKEKEINALPGKEFKTMILS
jgi:hypothetical protein